MKPFKPPLLKNRALNLQREPITEPPSKRRRVDLEDVADHQSIEKSPTKSPKPIKQIKQERNFRPPLLQVSNSATSSTTKVSEIGSKITFNVLWRKHTTKKHKTWDGDALIVLSGGIATLMDSNGREMGKTPWNNPLFPGTMISIGGKEVEVDSVVSESSGTTKSSIQPSSKSSTDRLLGVSTPTSYTTAQQTKIKHATIVKPLVKGMQVSRFKNPLLNKTTMPAVRGTKAQPRHDPNSPNAVVLRRPDFVPNGKELVDVVVDPILGKHLRDHQKEGVKFLYECVMGMRSYGGRGAILADEMGLGKTLQTITLLWTLLKQNPISGDGPIIEKALVVCPASVVNNWRKEFRKWLGNERIGVFVDGNKMRLTDFTKGKSYNVMITSYERLRTIQEDLKKGAQIDIVIADEGHKLKTTQNKAAQAIKSLNTERVVILSGTPFQNDLGEFFAVVDLINPGILGKYGKFKYRFETPILKSRQPEANDEEKEKGETKSGELMEITEQFMLRRTADILSKFLPAKTEYVLFCRPTSAQVSVYQSVLDNPAFNGVFGSSEASLQLINILKKVCNSPTLLLSKKDKDLENPNTTIHGLLSEIPSSLLRSAATSGKLQVLDKLLYQIRTTTQEKVVLVSNYTSTLDILGNLLSSLSYTFLRLDGSTPTSKRQSLVDKFNCTDAATSFAFLLSAKSGGTGINLIGASRLILFDIDWNPATDLQAMARIHRDGQKRRCRIYRLLTQGALDEKIYQRQLTKMGLADSIVDKKASASSFTQEELRDLFTLDTSGKCRTHEILDCNCNGEGNVDALQLEQEKSIGYEGEGGEEIGEGGEGEEEGTVEGEEKEKSIDRQISSLHTLVKASQVDMEAQEEHLRRMGKTDKKKAKMLALMRYLHIDTSKVDEDMETLIEDTILLNVLKMEESRVSFLFSRTSATN